MATGRQKKEAVPENLRKQLALAVRSIQWSYAIFWSTSSRQPGVLEWGDGYYNGDIKTRKTVQTGEVNADQLGLQRTEQLRELYESLSEGETNPQGKRPSAALSPEDLTDTEWYFLVCMSFIFNIGQGLPGRTLAKNQTIWLCNAHHAESRVFSRSLLAKSASVQTVVCFPYLGGVVELGVTETVKEDANLVEHVRTSFLDAPHTTLSKIPSYIPENSGNHKDIACEKPDHEMLESNVDRPIDCQEVDTCSPNNSSNGFVANRHADSYMVEGMDASQAQSWRFMEDDVSNCVHNSVNSSDCISQNYGKPEKVVPLSNGVKLNKESAHDIQEFDQHKVDSLDCRGDDIHYHSLLSTLLKSSHQLILGPHFRNSSKESSFVNWKKGGAWGTQMLQSGTSQRLLKKVLCDVARMHGGFMPESAQDNGRKEDGIWRPEVDEIDRNHVLPERRREKINEKFEILGALIPSSGKGDKVTILDDTIDYVKELERRLEELESQKVGAALEAGTRRKSRDAIERTSDNCGTNNHNNTRKPPINKRKACDVEEMEPDMNLAHRNGNVTNDVIVSVIDQDALIEITCPWKEGLLLEIIEAVSNIHLDCLAVQSSDSEGILSMTIRCKLKESKIASAGMIRQALHKVVRKSSSHRPQRMSDISRFPNV